MPQMDKELFIEYIYWIFIVLLHLYSNYVVHCNFVKFYCRKFLMNLYYKEVAILRTEEEFVKNAYQKFCMRETYSL